MLKKAYDWIIKDPVRNGWIAGFLSLPFSKHTIHAFAPSDDWAPFIIASTFWSAFFGSAIASILAKQIPKRATYWKHRKTIKKLRKETTQPTIPLNAEQTIPMSLTEMLRAYYTRSTTHWTQQSIHTKNPIHAIQAASEHFLKDEYDIGIGCIRDALDQSRTPLTYSGISTLYYHFVKFCGHISLRIDPFRPDDYLTLGMLELFRQPGKTLYYTQLAANIADTLNLDERAALHVCHALTLNTLNQPAEHAWNTAFAIMHASQEPTYFGSRNPVWTYKDPFLANTIVCKQNKRDALEREARAALTLDSILDGRAISPEPLAIIPHEDGHVYLFRYLKGTTVYDEILEGNTSATPDVIDVQAHIHAHYPTRNLERVDLIDKTHQKLTQLAGTELANAIMQDYAPFLTQIIRRGFVSVNTDMHPRNRQDVRDHTLTDADIGILDTEYTHAQEATLDWANYYRYTPAFTLEEELAGIQRIATGIQEEGARTQQQALKHAYQDTRALRQDYLLGVPHRMISMAAANKPPERADHDKIPYFLEQTVHALDELKRIDPTFCEEHPPHARLREKFTHLYAND